MAKTFRRVGRDVIQRRHLDAYVVAAASLVLAVLSLVGDLISDEVRWAVLFAALGLLVYRITVPEPVADAEQLLRDRTAFENVTFASRLKDARELWIFAPSAVNLLGGSTADDLRRTVLARSDGLVRVAILNPRATAAVDLASHQLDSGLDFPVQGLREALETTEARLRTMKSWDVHGVIESRNIDYCPGFSLVIINPRHADGTVLLEIHGFRNTATSNRMHLELGRRDSAHWFDHWVNQFERLWRVAVPVDEE